MNTLAIHLGPETWAKIIVGIEFTALAIFVIRMMIEVIKADRIFKKKCKFENKDWRAEDYDLIIWRNFLRTFGMRFLIRRKYRNLNE